MNDRDQRRYDRAVRVQTFGRENTAHFAPGSKAPGHLAAIDAPLVKLDAAKATLLDALHLDLKNIARTARAIEKTEPGFAAIYRMPDDITEAALTTLADTVLGRLEDKTADTPAVKTAKAALRAKFTAYELPAHFVADLRADRDARTTANRVNQGENQEGVESTALISDLLGKVNDEVVQLDAIMHNRYARRPEKLRAWQSASHVERAPQREKKPAAPPVAPTGHTPEA